MILRIILSVFTVLIVIYTCLVMAQHGINFAPTVFENLYALDWSGQFALDLSMYLLLSGLWVAWRHRFSATGILLGLICGIGGMFYFAPYVLIVSFQTRGNMTELLLGQSALNITPKQKE